MIPLRCPYCAHASALSEDAVCGRCPCGATYWNLPERQGWEKKEGLPLDTPKR